MWSLASIWSFLLENALVEGLVVGFLVWFAMSLWAAAKPRRAVLTGLIAVPFALVMLIWVVLFYVLNDKGLDTEPVHAWLMGLVAGLVAGFVVDRVLSAVINLVSHAFTRRTTLERNRRTDVRQIAEFLPEVGKPYDPKRYFNAKKGVFLGLNEQGKPLYWQNGTLPHVQVCGTTGSGKGVFLGMVGPQCLQRGEAVFYLDPKNDLWGPHVLRDGAQRAGVPYHFVDLRPGSKPAFNMFAGCTPEQIEELMMAGFGLTERGEAADFYRIADRQAAAAVARAVKPGDTPATVYGALHEFLEKEAPGFAGQLRELAELTAVNATGGIDLRKVVAQGGAVYVVGSMRNTKVIRVQRMLLVRVIQLAEERDRLQGEPRPICVVLDELKYHVSRPALEALGAARDKGLHVVMAHQALGDLRDCPADLNADAVTSAVMENGLLKFVYRVQDPETATWLARKSGTIQVDDETRTVTRGLSLVEKVSGERVIRQAERFYIDENMILNLPTRVGVLYGMGLPQFVSTSPYQVTKSADSLSTTAGEGGQPAFDGAAVDFSGLD